MAIPQLRAPIILVHGVMGFDRLRLGGAVLANYFRGIPEVMEAAGNRVFVASLAPTASVAHRAQDLKAFIDKHSAREPVHLIAHSMGGLDSRYMISKLDMGERVLTLTTLGTPHRGTSFADWGVGRFARIIKPLLDEIGLPYQAFYDLRRCNCEAFNEQVLDAPGVRYFSVVGKHDGHLMYPEWLLSYPIVLKYEGENDGIVSIQSATYGQPLGIWEGDHLRLVNWYHPAAHYRGQLSDPAERYGSLLKTLADFGY